MQTKENLNSLKTSPGLALTITPHLEFTCFIPAPALITFHLFYDHEILKAQGHLLSIFNLAPVSMTFRQVLVYDSVVFFFLSDTVDTFRVVLAR